MFHHSLWPEELGFILYVNKYIISTMVEIEVWYFVKPTRGVTGTVPLMSLSGHMKMSSLVGWRESGGVVRASSSSMDSVTNISGSSGKLYWLPPSSKPLRYELSDWNNTLTITLLQEGSFVRYEPNTDVLSHQAKNIIYWFLGNQRNMNIITYALQNATDKRFLSTSRSFDVNPLISAVKNAHIDCFMCLTA